MTYNLDYQGSKGYYMLTALYVSGLSLQWNFLYTTEVREINCRQSKKKGEINCHLRNWE